MKKNADRRLTHKISICEKGVSTDMHYNASGIPATWNPSLGRAILCPPRRLRKSGRHLSVLTMVSPSLLRNFRSQRGRGNPSRVACMTGDGQWAMRHSRNGSYQTRLPGSQSKHDNGQDWHLISSFAPSLVLSLRREVVDSWKRTISRR